MNYATWGPPMPRPVAKERRSPPLLGDRKAKQTGVTPEITEEQIDRAMKLAFGLLASDEARRSGKLN